MTTGPGMLEEHTDGQACPLETPTVSAWGLALESLAAVGLFAPADSYVQASSGASAEGSPSTDIWCGAYRHTHTHTAQHPQARLARPAVPLSLKFTKANDNRFFFLICKRLVLIWGQLEVEAGGI